MKEVTGIRLHPEDTVLVLAQRGEAGDCVCAEGIALMLAQTTPGGHKVALRPVRQGEPVFKYGFPIGKATRTIFPGEWVHEHNLATALTVELNADWTEDSEPDPEKEASLYSESDTPPAHPGGVAVAGGGAVSETAALPFTHFPGYARADGRPGIRNDLWIIPTVGCINGELEALAASWIASDLPRFPWIDGVKVLSHPFGCSQLGGDLEQTADCLAGLARNPNAAGVVIAGLGCENLSQGILRSRIGQVQNVRYLTLQEQDGAKILFRQLEELALAAPRERSLFPLSQMVVGVKCGGSDGYSGLTANPLVGRFADRLVQCGGVVLATEIPEMFGAEQALLPRMATAEVRNDFLALASRFRRYFAEHGQPVYENPSPGNREGGISTLEEKSLGAVEKSGTSPVVAILPMGAQARTKAGVQILWAPGNDLVSCTALAAAGAQIILFTTGRGTPFGTVVPTLKIATNSKVAAAHPDWIDFDAGVLLQKGAWNRVLEALCSLVQDMVEGRKAAHEKKRIAQIALFKDGVIL